MLELTQGSSACLKRLNNTREGSLQPVTVDWNPELSEADTTVTVPSTKTKNEYFDDVITTLMYEVYMTSHAIYALPLQHSAYTLYNY